MDTTQSENQHLWDQIAHLQRNVANLGNSISSLGDRNRRLVERINRLEAWRRSGPVHGLHLAEVVGDGDDGEPAAIDAEGRVAVKVFWDGQDTKMLARVADPWLIEDGGVQFLPRKGQTVYLAFEQGRPELPIITGYHPDADHALPYDPSSSTAEGTLAATKDAEGNAYNPATQNKYKSVLRSASGGNEGKASEIAFVDQSGSEALTLATDGELRIFSEGDAYKTVEGKSIDTVGGNETRNIEGEQKIEVKKDQTLEVGGTREITIQGNKEETIVGEYSLSIDGKKKVEVAEKLYEEIVIAEASFHFGAVAEAFLGVKAELNGGITGEAYIGYKVEFLFSGQAALKTGVYEELLVGVDQTYVVGEHSILMVEKDEEGVLKATNEVSHMANEIAELKETVADMDTTEVHMHNYEVRIAVGQVRLHTDSITIFT